MFRRIVHTLVLVSALLNAYIYTYPLLHGCEWASDTQIKLLALGDPQIGGYHSNMSARKRLDIFGNDFYLGHVYATLKRWLEPSHVAVMGDLLSSQWVDDQDFLSRVTRYRQRIFPDGHGPHFYNVSGNHDIGYGGEMNAERVGRFEAEFGQVNFVHTFNDGKPDAWRIVVLNSLALDGSKDERYADDTRKFLAALDSWNYDGATVLLTHLPLYKQEGICRDGPFFDYYEDGQLRGQNHMSAEASTHVLNALFSPKSGGGVILTGHDHEGCLSYYDLDLDKGQWRAQEWLGQNNTHGVREIVVRSIMGEYGGNGGLVSGHFNPTNERWEFDYSLCRFAVQHLWWATKVVTILSGLGVSILVLT